MKKNILTIFVLVLVAGSVQAQNNPPTVTSPIPDVTLRPNEQHIINDLNGHFSDPDGDPLTYSATSSDNSVATVSVTDTTLTVTAQPTISHPNHNTDITVTADDDSGGIALDVFEVAVNSPPNVENRIEDKINDKRLNYPNPPSYSITIDLDQVFTDQDGDQMSYSLENSNSSVATVSISGSILMVTAVSSGTATITVTADDGYGGTATDDFIVEVNSPPIITTSILDRKLSPDEPDSINLNNHFSDPDTDQLTYSAETSDTSVVTVSFTGDTLTVAPKSNGIVTVTVTANDGFGGTVDISFEVIVINFNPYVIKTIGNIDLTVGIPENFKVDLDSVFADPYKSKLTFTAASSNDSVAQALILADMTTLMVFLTHPKLGDSTRIIIKAVNKENFSGSTEFTVKVNFRPRERASIPDTNLTVGDHTFQQDLNLIFKDPDGDILSYTASSSNNSIAIASISNNSIIVSLGNPKVGDSAIIRVVADDQRGGLDTTLFSVKVNFRPTIMTSIPDTILTVGGPTLKQNLNFIFTDPDGDKLSYKASSKDDSVAKATISADSTLIVFLTDPKPEDTAIIWVEAGDQRGSLATDSFTVKVNFPPKRGILIPDTTLTPEYPVFAQDLSLIFIDFDSDKLSYTTNSSDKLVALASISTDSIIVSSSNRWIDASATVIVTADDQRGGVATDSFAVKTIAIPPKVSVLELYTPLENEDFTILADITEYNIIDSIKINFRPGGYPDFIESPMQKLKEGTMIYQCQIPGEYVTNKGIELYITAKDRYGLTNPNKLNFISVIIPEPGITREKSQPYGSEQTAYRLFSVPLQLDNSNPEAVLDELGGYNKVKWRFFEDDSTKEYDPKISKIIPGKAYWLIVKDKKNPIDTGGGRTTIPDSTGYFQIHLNQEWNDIGNPFNFPIPFNKLSLKSNRNQALDIRYYDGYWKNADDSLRPFEGYAIYTKDVDTLLIDPQLYPVSGKQLKISATSIEEDFLWSINIQAQCQEALDVDNIAAVTKKASPDWDEIDRPEPPVIGEYVSVSFPHSDWERPLKSYSTDARPEPLEGVIWEFSVRTNINDKVKLSFEGLDQVPEPFEVWLVDKKLNITQNLREKNTYFIAGSNAKSPKSLELVVGNNGFVDKQLAEIRIIPETYELAQNFPNPFNPSTTIKYGLPKADKVTLKIFNISGQEVVTLVNKEVRPAGYHAVVWDGKNNQGIIVANGIYLCHFQAGNSVIVKKMAFVK